MRHHDALLFADQASNELFKHKAVQVVDFPIQSVSINWEQLISNRGQVMGSSREMPAYLLMPEILRLLDQEVDSTYRLIMELM